MKTTFCIYYHQITTEIPPKEWVYDDFTSYVVTHKQKTSSDKIRFVNEHPVDLIRRLRKKWKRNMDMWWSKYYSAIG